MITLFVLLCLTDLQSHNFILSPSSNAALKDVVYCY